MRLFSFFRTLDVASFLSRTISRLTTLGKLVVPEKVKETFPLYHRDENLQSNVRVGTEYIIIFAYT